MCHTKEAGRDIVTRENKTHIEQNTRRVYVKEGWSLFKWDDNASTSTSTTTGAGFSGIGIVGEILIIFLIFVLLIWGLKKCLAKKVRHDSYKAYYRATLPSSQKVPSLPAITYNPPLQDEETAVYGPRLPRSSQGRPRQSDDRITISPSL